MQMPKYVLISRYSDIIELSSRYFDTLKVWYRCHVVSRYFNIDTIWPSSSMCTYLVLCLVQQHFEPVLECCSPLYVYIPCLVSCAATLWTCPGMFLSSVCVHTWPCVLCSHTLNLSWNVALLCMCIYLVLCLVQPHFEPVLECCSPMYVYIPCLVSCAATLWTCPGMLLSSAYVYTLSCVLCSHTLNLSWNVALLCMCAYLVLCLVQPHFEPVLECCSPLYVYIPCLVSCAATPWTCPGMLLSSVCVYTLSCAATLWTCPGILLSSVCVRAGTIP